MNDPMDILLFFRIFFFQGFSGRFRDRADRFLAQVGDWFKKNMPSVHTEYRLKAGGFADDDPKLNAEVKAKGNAVIMAIGH